MDESIYSDLGFYIKLDVGPDLGKMGFCQNYFDVKDPDPRNIVDPLKHLGKFAWTTSAAKHGSERVLKELARAKCFSLLHLAPGNPVLDSMSRWILRATKGSQVRFSNDWWEREKMRDFNGQVETRVVTWESRVIVRDLFGLSISDQIHLEKWFDSQNEIRVIDDPVAMRVCRERNPDWALNWNLSVENVPAGWRW